MSLNPEKLRRAAKNLKKDHALGTPDARARVAAVLPETRTLKHADALHVVAREAGFDSWPKLKFTAQAQAMDKTARVNRLKMALFHGQEWVVDQLLAQDPTLRDGAFEIQVAMFDKAAVEAAISRDPRLATTPIGPRRPILHLAFSKWLQGHPELEGDMLAIAEILCRNGADVNDAFPWQEGETHMLPALYGALGHADNMPLSRWLLEHGADPNDNESLYHATELGHHEGLDMLISFGAKPAGTNALLRAMDFNDHLAVEKLLSAGADPNEGIANHPSGQPPEVVSALHQAARRDNDTRMVEILIAAGADLEARYQGITAYAMARACGSRQAADALAAAGAKTSLPEAVQLLADAAEGRMTEGVFVDPAKLPQELRNLLRTVIAEPSKFDFAKRLVAIGIEWDRPDSMGLTPVQIAGWEGLPEQMAYLLAQRPDLGHINGYGGTLLSTVIHGSENCPARSQRDHIACARLALEEGVALPRPAIRHAGDADMAEFLSDWADTYPGQVVEHGIG